MANAGLTLSALTPAAGSGQEPRAIAQYAIVEIPRPGETYVAAAPGGRRVVLKMLEADCLSGAQLHPNIRDRLSRVREAATLSLANLLGVERDGNRVFIVWEYVEGTSLAEALASDSPPENESPLEALLLVREILLAVNSLHALSLVHGALHANNIFIRRGPAGERRILLTHVSPFLYSEPSADVRSIVAALATLIGRRRQEHSPLGRLLGEAQARDLSLDRLIARLNELIDGRRREGEGGLKPALHGSAAVFSEAQDQVKETPSSPLHLERRRRRWAVGKVAFVIIAAIVIFFGLRRVFHR